MKSRLQRVEEQLAKEQHAADIRRFKQVLKTVRNASALLTVPFYESGHTELAQVVLDSLKTQENAISEILGVQAKEGE